jgi:diaminopimelate epimerase
MRIQFYKYEGTGNDFIMIDNRNLEFPKKDIKLVKKLCDRRFGIGADGLILLENDSETDFRMVYYNSDGNQSSMCGNGGRCIVAFAKQLNIIQDAVATFIAIDGLHQAIIQSDSKVSLQMKNVPEVVINENYVFLNTGSPHHIQFVEDLKNYDVKKMGASIRYGDLYGKEGSNVNFVSQVSESEYDIRTYERGVEDETLSCGTGATAVAIAMNALSKTDKNKITINVLGGKLEVIFEKRNDRYSHIYLNGPATFVFSGQFDS